MASRLNRTFLDSLPESALTLPLDRSAGREQGGRALRIGEERRALPHLRPLTVFSAPHYTLNRIVLDRPSSFLEGLPVTKALVLSLSARVQRTPDQRKQHADDLAQKSKKEILVNRIPPIGHVNEYWGSEMHLSASIPLMGRA